MSTSNEEPAWNQHYPTYHFKERDIALEEYRSAVKSFEAEERVFLNAANLTVIVGAALGSLALGSLDKLTNTFKPIVPELILYILILTLSIGFTILSLHYFSDRQKAVVFAARKVIVLRRMLGMNYGSLQLVLPNWRIEGANEPFAIKLFPGWNTYVAYPCFAISGISTAVAFFVIATIFKHIDANEIFKGNTSLYLIIGISISWLSLLAWIYRKSLLDTHESVNLLLLINISRWLNLKLANNFENIIYRAKLGAHELRRIGIRTTNIKKILIHIEDKEFYSHCGVSLRGMMRLASSILGIGRRSGGSTVTQQLVRTLFISDLNKTYRRKFIEIFMAIWLDKALPKENQLDMYLASVRFEANTNGLAAAINHFFGSPKKFLSNPEAFFLIERISNINSRILVNKVDSMLRSSVEENILSEDEATQTVFIYSDAVRSGKIKDKDNKSINQLLNAWNLPLA